MTQSAQERPWKPSSGGPGLVLVNPEGTRHLMFADDKGQWYRIFESGTSQPLQVDEAIRLRPSDVDTIIKWTFVWCLQQASGDERVTKLIEDLAYGLKVTISYLIQQAGLR
jgi:hypothetical protein